MRYKRCRVFAGELKERREKYDGMRCRTAMTAKDLGIEIDLPMQVFSKDEYEDAVEAVCARNDVRFADISNKITHILRRDKLSIKDRIKSLWATVVKKGKFMFSELFKDKKTEKGKTPVLSPEEQAALQAQRESEQLALLVEGATVKLKGQNTVGTIMEIHGKDATVAFGSIKTTVKLNRLEPAKAPSKQPDITQKATYLSEQTQDSMHDRKLNFKQDIDVRGMRGDEAIQAVTYFIDDAILVGVSRVRILHGTGTGILRTLIRQYLQSVAGVKGFHDEHVQFGGAGITVVDLD